MLVAAGAERKEAFAVIFHPSTAEDRKIQVKARELAEEKPGINKLIKSFETNYNLQPQQAEEQEQGKKKRKKQGEESNNKGNLLDYRDKSSILEAMCQELPYLRGKDRVAVLMSMADLQRMKQDENKEEEERIHYYLPMKCALCPLFRTNKEAKQEEAGRL